MFGAILGAVGAVTGLLGMSEARQQRKAAEHQGDAQYALGMEQLGLQREQLATSKELAQQQLGFAREQFDWQKGISEQQLGIEKLMSDISAEQWENYKTKALPLLDELASMRTDMTEERVAQAIGDTRSQFATQRENLTRALERTRSPADPGYGALLAPTYMDEAAAVSRTIDETRQAERERNFERTAQVVQGYQALPSQAIGAGGTALSSAAQRAGQAGANARGAMATATNLTQGALAATGNAPQYFSGGNAAYTRAAQASQDAAQAIYGGTSLALMGYDAYRKNQQPEMGYNANANYWGQDLEQPDFSGGYYREGGRVRGPGTETSDSIPARLSKGEYVIPADVVRVKGQEFFDKLLQKYHRPVMSAEQQRGDMMMANGGPVLKGRGLPKAVNEAIFRSVPTRAMSRTRR